ncbi:hypothetical protein LCGC14_1315930 [marine sediment metagenome]|uniref:Uncharacterized protein n=1 Tax=marine sediment metagenome TaxID=412755 RepID=A0A0F9N1W3_9ZZZZ
MEETIDPSLVNIIKTLNKLNYPTSFSCSGIYKDHKKDNVDKQGLGYICFERLSNNQINILKKICSKVGISYEKDDGDSTVVIRNALSIKQLVEGTKIKESEIALEAADQWLENMWKQFIEEVKILKPIANMKG